MKKVLGWRSVAIVAGSLIALVRWNRLDNLLTSDTSTWLTQAYLFSLGKLPYRDFTLQYPPLATAMLGYCFRWFGATFNTASAVAVAASAVVLILFADLAARVLDKRTARLFLAMLIGFGALSGGPYALFSLRVYTLSIFTCTAGILGFLRLQPEAEKEWKTVPLLAASLCVLLAVGSKPEGLVAIVGAILARTLYRGMSPTRWGRDGIAVPALFLPTALFFGWWARAVGTKAMLDGLGGYGSAGASCPWWPTGIGLLGAAGAVAEAVLWVAALSLLARRLGRQEGMSVKGAAVAAILGAVLFFGAVAVRAEFVADRFLNIWSTGLVRSLAWVVSWSALLQPALWVGLAVWVWGVVALLRDPRGFSFLPQRTFVALSALALMTGRGVFGSVVDPFPVTPVITYPFWMLFTFVFLDKVFLPRFETGREKWFFAAKGLIFFVPLCVRVSYGVSSFHQQEILTAAGAISLDDAGDSARLLKWRSENLDKKFWVLPYGGALYFASGYRGPFPFVTVNGWFEISEASLRRDRETFEREKIDTVFTLNDSSYGLGFGKKIFMGCQFPAIAKLPAERPWQPRAEESLLPVLQAQYRSTGAPEETWTFFHRISP